MSLYFKGDLAKIVCDYRSSPNDSASKTITVMSGRASYARGGVTQVFYVSSLKTL